MGGEAVREKSRDMQRFEALVATKPDLAGYWDFDKRELDKKRVDAEIGGLSSGEQVMLSFFCSVWFGKNYGFDFIRAAGALDNANKRLICEWFADPFWP